MRRPTIVAAVLAATVSAAAIARGTISDRLHARTRLIRVALTGTTNSGLVTSYIVDEASRRVGVLPGTTPP